MNTILKACLVTIIYVLLIELIGIWIIIPFFSESQAFTKNIWPYYELVNGLLTFILVHWYFYRYHKDIYQQKMFGSPIYYLPILALGPIFVYFQFPLNLFFDSLFNTEYAVIYFFNPRIESINLLSRILFLPIAEELIFRGLLLGKIFTGKNKVFGLFISSFLFAAMHYDSLTFSLVSHVSSLHQVYIAFFGGIICGILFIKFKTIYASIAFHISWNLSVYLFSNNII